MVITYAIGFRKMLNALVNGQKYAQIGHTVSHIDHMANSIRKPGTNLHKMSLRRTENRDRTPRLFTIVVQIWIMIRTVVMEPESLTQFCYSNMTTIRNGIDREVVDIDILFQRWREHTLQSPHASVVIGMIGNIIF